MEQRPPFPPVDPTRRRFLSYAAGAAAGGGALALAYFPPATAAPAPSDPPGALAGSPDPIFAVIDAHKAARRAFHSAIDRGSRLEEELPSEKTRSIITIHERRIFEMDDPRWIESVEEVYRTSDAEEEAACVLVSVKPATMAGVVALLHYANSIPHEEWPVRLVGEDDKEKPWCFFLIETVAAALPDMAVQS